MDEQGVLRVWQNFWGCVFHKVVQNGGFVRRGEITSGASRLVAQAPGSTSRVHPSSLHHFNSVT